jgi:hypothetical protein
MAEIKAFNVKVPKELWAYLKKRSVDCDMSMNDIVNSLLRKYKERNEKKLTIDDA